MDPHPKVIRPMDPHPNVLSMVNGNCIINGKWKLVS
jgi:hypothetical protein